MILKRLRPALLCVTFLYLAAAAAQAEPVSTAIGLTALIAEVGVSTAVAGAIGGAIISTGIAVGSTLIARALQPKPGEENQTTKGTQASVSIGADVPRNRVYGKQAIAGQLGYWNVYGPDNVFLQLRFTLGVGPHAFFGLFANGKRCTLGANLPGWGLPITDFQFIGIDTAWVRFYAGYYDQAIDAGLVDNAVPPGRYASTNVGRGCCYAVVTLGYKAESYPQGIPQFQFEIGAQLYDPRKDSSTGGAGAHRWTDQHTWEWSDNPALALYEYERGLMVGTHRAIGRGLAPVDILRGAFIDAANICDEVVTNKDASTEPRYRIGMNVGADRELKSVEADFCTAFAGALIEQAGAYGPLAGVAQDVVATFTDADLIQGKPVRYSDKRPRDQLVNALFGVYSEPAQNYQAVPYAPRTSSADESADGDRFAARRDYVQILSQTQAQRVGEIDRREGRYQGTGAVTLGFKYSYLESGDWVRWISARRNFDKLFRVTQHRLAPDQTISLTLDETANDVFAFDTDVDELDPLAPGDLPGIGVKLQTVPDLEAEALQLVDAASGLKTPAIRALWSPIIDRTVDRVRLQYRLASQPDAVHDSDPFPPDDGEGIIASGIQAAGGYEIRGTIDTTPVRLTTWTAWVAVTAAAEHIVPTALTAHLVDELAGVPAELRAAVQHVLGRLSDLENFVGGVTGRLEVATATSLVEKAKNIATAKADLSQTQTEVSGLSLTVGDHTARISIVEDVTVGPDSVLAHLTTDLEAAMSGAVDTFHGTPTLASTVHTDLLAFTGPDGTYAVDQLALKSALTGDSDTYGGAVTLLSTLNDDFVTFAGPGGTYATRDTELVSSITGSSDTLDGTATLAASVRDSFTTFAGPGGTYATRDSQLKAAITGSSATIDGTQTAAADIDGRVGALWGLKVETDVHGVKRAVSVKAGADGTEAFFRVSADSIVFSLDGYTDVGLLLGTIDGVPTLGWSGQVMLDGEVYITKTAHMADAIINNRKVGANEVTSSVFLQPASDLTFSSTGSFTAFEGDVTFNGVAGRSVTIDVLGPIQIESASGGTAIFQLTVDITTLSQNVLTVTTTLTATEQWIAARGVTVTATGSSQSVHVKVTVVRTSGSNTFFMLRDGTGLKVQAGML